MYFPKGIVAQSAEAGEKAKRYNATVGLAQEKGEPFCLSDIYSSFVPGVLSKKEIFSYAPGGGDKELRAMWKKAMVEKKEHIFKLKELGIKEVFIKDDGVDAEDTTILKVDITNKCKDKVKSIISKHIYNGNDSGMEEIIDTADKIIDDILENDDIVEQIYDIKERSSDIYEHSISTCSMAMIIALKMRLKQSLVHDIAVGCLLHDIGLRYITVEFEDIEPEDMIPKDHEEYCKHPVYGYSAVKDEEWLGKESKEIILGHHERLDGSGYPHHVTEMTIGTKIVALCDYFDEAICGIGRRRHKVHEVLEYIKAYSSIKFDKQVVEVLLDFTAVYPSKSTVITNECYCQAAEGN